MESFRHLVLFNIGVAEIGDVPYLDMVELSRILAFLCQSKYACKCIGINTFIHFIACNFILQVDYRSIV